MFKKFVIAVAIILYGAFCFYAVNSAKAPPDNLPAPILSTPKPTLVSVNSDKLFLLVNNWRTTNGLNALVKDDQLCNFANLRLKDIHSDYSHNGFFAKKGSLKFSYLGENLAADFYSDQAVLNAWLNSPTHKDNIDDPYQYSCIVNDSKYVVQEFGTL